MENEFITMKTKVLELQTEIQCRVREVKKEFYSMIRKILVAFTNAYMLPDFKGADTRSGHMRKYNKW